MILLDKSHSNKSRRALYLYRIYFMNKLIWVNLEAVLAFKTNVRNSEIHVLILAKVTLFLF